MGAEQIDYYKAKYKTLEDLPSVGPATATKLREIGFKTVESVAMATVLKPISLSLVAVAGPTEGRSSKVWYFAL